MTQTITRIVFVLLCLALALPAAAQDATLIADAKAAYDEGDYQIAVDLLEVGEVRSAEGVRLLARAYWMLANYANVLRTCDGLLKRDLPNDQTSECYALNAAAYASIGDVEKADEAIATLDRITDANSYPLLRANYLNDVGDGAGAAALFETYVNSVSSDPIVAEDAITRDVSALVEISPNTVVVVSLDVQNIEPITLESFSVSGTVDSVIVLLDPSGQPIGGDDNSLMNGDSALSDVFTSQTGTYRLLVTHGMGDAEGMVQISWIVRTADEYMTLGDEAARVRDFTRAEEYYQRALDLGVNTPQLYAALASVQYLTEQHDEAIQSLNAALELSPENGYYYLSRAVSYAELGNVEQALRDAEKGFDLAGGDGSAHLSRGIVYTLAGEPALAAADYMVWINANQSITQSGTISVSTPVEVPMSRGSVFNLTFEGTAGQTVTFEAITQRTTSGVEPAPDVDDADPLLVILSPNGDPLAGDDDGYLNYTRGTDASVTFTLPEDGTYTLVVSHAGGGYYGDVDITMTISQ
jgi:tetratricopeptide (TPR) repeat protein